MKRFELPLGICINSFLEETHRLFAGRTKTQRCGWKRTCGFDSEVHEQGNQVGTCHNSQGQADCKVNDISGGWFLLCCTP